MNQNDSGKEIRIDYYPDSTGKRQPHLIVTPETLAAILYNENSVIAERDVALLMGAMCSRAIEQQLGDTEAAETYGGEFFLTRYCEWCDRQPCECVKEPPPNDPAS